MKKNMKLGLTIVLCVSILVLLVVRFDLKDESEIKNLDIPLADAPVDMEIASIVMTWQLDNGGWMKSNKNLYVRTWDGEEFRNGKGIISPTSVERGNIKGVTHEEIRYLLKTYRELGDEEVKEAVFRGIDFLLEMQYDSGGFPQMFPLLSTEDRYENMVTFNDDAMVDTLSLFRDLLDNNDMYDEGFFSEEYIANFEKALLEGIDYVINAQIEVDGIKTAWGQQHHPVNYEPRPGRSFELIAIAGFESVGVVEFLQSVSGRYGNEVDVKLAIDSAIKWFDEVKVEDTMYYYRKKNNEFFVKYQGRDIWYRYYEIGTNQGFFVSRAGEKFYDLYELEKVDSERALGYAWAGRWARDLID